MHTEAMNWKERQKFESGITHGIALAMLSAGMAELAVDERSHALWSYTHRMSIKRNGGSIVYRISRREEVVQPDDQVP